MRITRLIAIALATTALAFAGCTATPTQKTAGETIDDATITASVKSALIADSSTEARNINVDTRRGVVQLNGFVETAEGRARATQIATAVAGVRSVENNLGLKSDQRSAGRVIDDGTITTSVKMALANSPATKAYEIKVETYRGRVQLGGWVNSPESREEAGRLARGVEGVTAVENNLDVRK